VTDPGPSNGARTNGALTDAELADLELADAELADIELADIEAIDTEQTDAEPTDTELTDNEAAETEASDTELDDAELAEDAVLDSALEALLLVVDEPVDEAQLAAAVAQPTERVATALRRLAQHYRDQERGIDLRQVGAGWRFYTRDRYAPYVERMLRDGQRAKLTRAALETLAVVAYRQPVTRARVSAVRGVNCDGVLRTLVTRGLVEEFGIDPQTQGILYRTSELFLERLGLSSLAELPPLAPLLPEVDAIDDV
jgi:segregation and condensation protein B